MNKTKKPGRKKSLLFLLAVFMLILPLFSSVVSAASWSVSSSTDFNNGSYSQSQGYDGSLKIGYQDLLDDESIGTTPDDWVGTGESNVFEFSDTRLQSGSNSLYLTADTDGYSTSQIGLDTEYIDSEILFVRYWQWVDGSTYGETNSRTSLYGDQESLNLYRNPASNYFELRAYDSENGQVDSVDFTNPNNQEWMEIEIKLDFANDQATVSVLDGSNSGDSGTVNWNNLSKQYFRLHYSTGQYSGESGEQYLDDIRIIGGYTSGTWSSQVWDSGASVEQKIDSLRINSSIGANESVDARVTAYDDSGSQVDQSGWISLEDGDHDYRNEINLDPAYQYQIEYNLSVTDNDTSHTPRINSFKLETVDANKWQPKWTVKSQGEWENNELDSVNSTLDNNLLEIETEKILLYDYGDEYVNWNKYGFGDNVYHSNNSDSLYSKYKKNSGGTNGFSGWGTEGIDLASYKGIEWKWEYTNTHSDRTNVRILADSSPSDRGGDYLLDATDTGIDSSGIETRSADISDINGTYHIKTESRSWEGGEYSEHYLYNVKLITGNEQASWTSKIWESKANSEQKIDYLRINSSIGINESAEARVIAYNQSGGQVDQSNWFSLKDNVLEYRNEVNLNPAYQYQLEYNLSVSDHDPRHSPSIYSFSLETVDATEWQPEWSVNSSIEWESNELDSINNTVSSGFLKILTKKTLYDGTEYVSWNKYGYGDNIYHSNNTDNLYAKYQKNSGGTSGFSGWGSEKINLSLYNKIEWDWEYTNTHSDRTMAMMVVTTQPDEYGSGTNLNTTDTGADSSSMETWSANLSGINETYYIESRSRSWEGGDYSEHWLYRVTLYTSNQEATWTSQIWDSQASNKQKIDTLQINSSIGTNESVKIRLSVDEDDDGSIEKTSNWVSLSDGTNNLSATDFDIGTAGYQYQVGFNLSVTDGDSSHSPVVNDFGLSTTEANNLPNVSNPSPSGGTVLGSTDSVLSVDLSDADGDSMDSWFFNADNNEQIGSKQTGIDGNGSASVSWTGLQANTTYDWYVNVSDGKGNYTSDTFTFEVGLGINLTFKDSSIVEDGFNVYTNSSGTWNKVHSFQSSNVGGTGQRNTNFIDKNLEEGERACYRVAAFNEAGESSHSGEACVTP